MHVKRVFLKDNLDHKRDRGELSPRYEIERADWVWHPDGDADAPVLCRFRVSFNPLPDHPELLLHVSGDQQYQLFLDGDLISGGPEAGDVEHWSFSSLRIGGLEPGDEHRIDALVWWLGEHAPTSRLTHRPGFILKAEEPYDECLTTGIAPWEVQKQQGFSCEESHFPFSNTCLDTSVQADSPYQQVKAIAPGLEPDIYRRRLLMGAQWQLTPARLGEQERSEWSGGRVRAILETTRDEPFTIPPEATEHPCIAEWNGLVGEQRQMVVPPNTEATVLWDLEDYVCGYTVIEASSGAEASVSVRWAESLFDEVEKGDKGNRSDVAGKTFRGCGDAFLLREADHSRLKPIWWRSGRFCAVSVTTDENPLTLHSLSIEETHYPVVVEGDFEAPVEDLAEITEMCQRSFKACAHDIYLDCPYYEQRMFVGDSLVEALTGYAIHRDARLTRRSIELFDYSRAANPAGLTTARYPCREATGISTFSMLWIWMIYDYFYWRDDARFIYDRLTGVRAVLNALTRYRDANGLVADLPGRSFVDWAFPNGDPPGAFETRSSVLNLIYLITLERASEMEEAVGDTEMAAFYDRQFQSTCDSVRRLFWDEERGCFADEPGMNHFSEHALVLSLFAGILNDSERATTAENLFSAEDLTRCNPYFKHYLFDAYHQFGRGDLILEELDHWRTFLEQGMKTTPENYPNATRSDCHGWSAHPLFHFAASIAGIRPGNPGFKTVSIAPSPGSLPELRARVPHPEGLITCELSFENGCTGTVTLPESVTGTFIWRGRDQQLSGGRNEIGGMES